MQNTNPPKCKFIHRVIDVMDAWKQRPENRESLGKKNHGNVQHEENELYEYRAAEGATLEKKNWEY